MAAFVSNLSKSHTLFSRKGINTKKRCFLTVFMTLNNDFQHKFASGKGLFKVTCEPYTFILEKV